MLKTISKKIAIFCLVSLISISAFAQQTLSLKYKKTIEFNDGVWGDVNIPYKAYSSFDAPKLTVDKLGQQEFKISFNDIDVNSIVNYSHEETQRMRQIYIDDSYHAYKYSESNDYLLTRGFTLDQIVNQPTLWSEAKSDLSIVNMMYTDNVMYIYSAYQQQQDPNKLLSARCAIYEKTVASMSNYSHAEELNFSPAPEDAFIEILQTKNPSIIKLRYFEKGKFIKTYDLKFVATDAPSHPDSDQHNEVYDIVNIKGGQVIFHNMILEQIFADRKAWNEMEHAFIMINDQPKTNKFTYIK